MRLRSHLVVLVLALLVPMTVFATITIVAFGRQQRAAVQQGAVETARALMSAVDHSLSSSITTLGALATPLTIAEIAPESQARLHPTAPSVDPAPAAGRLDGLRVLVVDDDRDALDLASMILTRAGAEVRVCRSTAEALDALGQWRPNVLVSDIEMPMEDGYSLIRKVRALRPEHGGKTPAVALTAYGRMQDRVVSLTAGYNMHVAKPVDPGEFTTIIASLAGRI